MTRKRLTTGSKRHLPRFQYAARVATLCLAAGAVGCTSREETIAENVEVPVADSGAEDLDDASTEKLANRPAESVKEQTGPADDNIKTFPEDLGIELRDVTAGSGIDFVHYFDGHDNRYIVETVASGIATFDYDSDGLPDICFLNGTNLPEPEQTDKPNQLYRNVDAFRFVATTAAARIGQVRHSLGVCTGDYDNDGFTDVFINNFGQNTLLHNQGDGTFVDVTVTAGVGETRRLGAGACFFDANGDGLLDLYVGNYVKAPIESNVKRTTDGFPSYPGPLDFQPEKDEFYLNTGDGNFVDSSSAAGIAEIATTSMGVLATDFDDDGDIDVLVVNDVQRNVLLENDGSGVFEDVGILQGIAFSYDASRNGNMGVDAADFDNDGSIDLYTTTFSSDLPVLYSNNGFGVFTDVTLATRSGASLVPHANWGTSFFDINNDGHQDIFVGNGHPDMHVGRWAHNTSWKVANTVFLSGGDRKFEDISKRSGSGLSPVESTRGIAVEDFDQDGREDLILLNAVAAPTLIKNESETTGNWLRVRLIGVESNRSAAGAKVSVRFGGVVQAKEVYCGRGYQSSYGHVLHFGLGAAEAVEEITIRWPSGKTSVVTDQPANQQAVVFENESLRSGQ
ncbi:MAG: hypothetical protein Aurels2KO_42370 [Aureliella sp.]